MNDPRFLWAAGFVLVASGAAASLCAGWLARAGLGPITRTDGRNAAIDGLRGFLALAVLANHFILWIGVRTFGRGWTPTEVFAFNHLGQGAVALFFMVTGFVYYPAILAGRLHDWPGLALRRFFRLQPLVAASVLAVVLICLARGGSAHAGSFWGAALVWLSCWSEPDLLGVADAGRINAYVFWSLKFEWLFTLALLPLCLLARRWLPRRAPGWLPPGGLLLLALGANFFPPLKGIAAPLVLLTPLFLIGMLAHEIRARAQLRALLASPACGALAALALAVAALRAPTPFAPAQLSLYGLFFCSVACGQTFGGLLNGAGAQALGAWSYPIYLFHGILLSLLFTEGGAELARLPPLGVLALLPPVACVVVGLAAFAHVWVEQPAAEFGRRLAARDLFGRVPAPAPALGATRPGR
jgi:peptidoglycan/LPS O-acetylase OafA/YrhL